MNRVRLAALAWAACACASPTPRGPQELGATKFGPVADLRVALPFQVHFRHRSPELSAGGSAVSAESLRRGDVQFMVMSLFVPEDLMGHQSPSLAELHAVLGTADDICARNPILRGPGESSGQIRVLYALEGSDSIAHEPERVRELVRRGVTLFAPVHVWHGLLCDSATDPRPGAGGLTPAGERWVRAVYAAGALVDVSHASVESFYEIAQIAEEYHLPLVASHSNARALADHRRNLDDDQLRVVATSDGVVGVCLHEPYLRQDDVTPTIRDVARHVRHLVDVMGPEHVALGTDLDGLIRPPADFETHAALPSLADALRQEGLGDQDRRDVLCNNAIRVLDGFSSLRVTE